MLTLYEQFAESMQSLDAFASEFGSTTRANRLLSLPVRVINQYGPETIDQWCDAHGWRWERMHPARSAWLRIQWFFGRRA